MVPHKNEAGNTIEWQFKDTYAYAEPVLVDGIHVGSIMRCLETDEVVGVKINLESVK